MKSVRTRNFSGLYFPAFGLNMERYGVLLNDQIILGFSHGKVVAFLALVTKLGNR